MTRLNTHKTEPLESTIQTRLITGLERKGWYVQKTEGRSRNGFPDVTAINPTGDVWFIELKRTVGKPSPDQCRELETLARHGANVLLAYGRNAIDTLLSLPDWPTNDLHRILIADSKGNLKCISHI